MLLMLLRDRRFDINLFWHRLYILGTFLNLLFSE